MNWISPQDTICETIRAIYNLSDNPKARLKCREAIAMAKAMSAKLTEYNRTWRNGFFEENHNFPASRGSKFPIDVLFLCWDDNANTGYRFWQCAKYLGLNSVMFKGKAHSFGYPAQAPLHPSLTNMPICSAPITVMAPGLESLISRSNVVHLIASTYPMSAVDFKKKNVVVQHGGTVYRQNPGACNELFNQFAKKTIIQCPDLLGLGAVNESWIYYPVDTALLKPNYETKGEKGDVVIGHFPSNADNKGTELIERVVRRLQSKGLPIKYVGSTKKVPWPENLNRIAQCDVIIEGCNTHQDNKVYGEWANTALEAAALGCAVITHCLSKDKYELEFGELGPVIANNETELENAIVNIRPDYGKKCREWAVRNHSIPATANRLWDLVYKDFF